MSGYLSSGWVGDPINAPHMIPLDRWWSYNLHAVAHCACGRVAVVHTAELLKRLNRHQAVDAKQLVEFSQRVKCIRCGAKGPKITLEVRKD